eukprot:COSAG02_NODE_1942_length_10310_cov_15.313877_5_plen_69_part_00
MRSTVEFLTNLKKFSEKTISEVLPALWQGRGGVPGSWARCVYGDTRTHLINMCVAHARACVAGRRSRR